MALIDNLLGYWKLDDTAASTVVIDSTGNNNGTGSQNSSIFTTAGLIGTAFEFDGNDAVDIPLDQGVGDTGRAYSMQVWLNGDTDQAEAYVFGTDNFGPDNGISITTGTIQARIMAGTRLDSSIAPSSGAWHHVVLTYDGTNGRLWVDGVDKGAVTAGALDRGASTIIGALNSGGTAGFDGQIDECAVWDKKLSNAEIAELYNSGAGLTYPFGISAGRTRIEMLGSC